MEFDVSLPAYVTVCSFSLIFSLSFKILLLLRHFSCFELHMSKMQLRNQAEQRAKSKNHAGFPAM
jgi:hypothetical protein